MRFGGKSVPVADVKPPVLPSVVYRCSECNSLSTAVHQCQEAVPVKTLGFNANGSTMAVVSLCGDCVKAAETRGRYKMTLKELLG